MIEITSACLRRKTNKSGKVWRGVIKYRDPEDPSKLRQMTKTLAAGTKSKANAELAAWRAEVEAQAKAPDASLTVPEYAERYVKALESAEAIERSTATNYRYTLLYIADGLSGIPLASLSPAEVQNWETGLLERGLSTSTVGKAHRLLKQVCKHAAAIGDLPRNPCDLVKPPKRVQGNPNALDKAGTARALTILSAMDNTPLSIAARIALFTGMRREEICALTWNDVDLGRAEITVSRALGMDNGSAYLKTPKTGGSRRTIPLPSKLVELLESHRSRMFAEWQDYVMRLEVPKTDDAFSKLFVIGDVMGNWHNPAMLTKGWATLAKSFKLVSPQGKLCTFHDLRHTFATRAIAEGADVKSVSSILGHANAAMTLNIYASADAEAKRRAATLIDKAMEHTPAEVILFRTGTEG